MKPLLRLLCVLSVLAWPSLAVAQNGVPYSANVQMPTFISSTTVGGSALLFYPDNTYDIGASGANRPKSLFLAQNATIGGQIAASGDINTAATGLFYWSTRGVFKSPSDGNVALTNNAQTIGSQLKADALPTVSACGAGSPAVVAGSTPMSGAVTIGTTSVATCTITFNGTAYPSAPHCNGAVETTTAANARAMGYSASTTVLTIVPSAAWADSSVVNWDCFSAK